MASYCDKSLFIRSDIFDNEYGGEVKYGFSRRLNVGFGKNGDSDDNVIHNRKVFAESCGIEYDRMISLNQTHSDIVHVIDEHNFENFRFTSKYGEMGNSGDAMITSLSGVAIYVKTADCAPILLYDRENSYVASIHCGWRGVLSGIIGSTLARMKLLGTKKLSFIIGPCIHVGSFECNGIADMLPEKFIVCDGSSKYFDLPGYCKDFILSNIDVDLCDVIPCDTFSCNDGTYEFFSYRRDGESYGVQGSFICLT